MKNILVTGAYGQLGKALSLLAAEYPSFNLFFTDIDTLDICDKEAVFSFLKTNYIHSIVNTAAYTAVDKAESEEQLAFRINCEGVRSLAEAAESVNSKIIHISTDYVFDGNNHRPYIETDPTHPASVYGRTKLAGETVLQEICREPVIIRTSWLYSETGNNFVKTMLRLGRERDEIGVVFDQTGTPTYAVDLARAVFSVLEREDKNVMNPGIYHFSNEGVCSWYDFAVKIMELAGLDCKVNPIETSQYPTPAVRPAYSVLNKTKIKTTYNISVPHWEESLRGMIKKIINND